MPIDIIYIYISIYQTTQHKLKYKFNILKIFNAYTFHTTHNDLSI